MQMNHEGNTMKTPPTKRSFQAALALTLLACSGLSGWSGSQEQGAANAGSSKAAVASTHTKVATAAPTASGKAKDADKPTATSTATLSPELEAAKKRALATPPPPKPELITVNNDDGAIATAKYWVQLHYYIYTTGKVDEYKALCPGNGDTATKPVKHATENYVNGVWNDPVTITFTKAFRRSDFKDNVVVQVNFERESVNQYDSNGKVTYREKQSRWAGVKLEYNGSQWIVIEAVNRES